MDSLKSVLQTLGENSRWAGEANASLRIRAVIRSWLPPELAQGTSASLPSPGLLTITCQNSLIATRVRHIVPSLKDKLKTIGLDLQVIQVDVDPKIVSGGLTYSRKRPPTPPPQGAASALDQLADKQGESPFGDALRRLAQRLRDL